MFLLMVTMEMFILANVLVCLGKHIQWVCAVAYENISYNLWPTLLHTYCVCFLCRLDQACNHMLIFIENHVKDEILPTEISKTSKPMIWNQPPKKTVAPECSSNMWFVKPSHGDLPVQRISRSTFDPHTMKHQGDVDKERESMPCSGLQHFWCDGPNTETNPSDVSLWSHVLFSHGSLNSTIKKVVDPTPIVCQQFVQSMKLSSREVAAIEAATREQSGSALWQAIRNGRLTSSRFGEILKRRQTTDSRRLVKDIMGYNEPMKKVPPQIRWGRDNEDRARQCYIENRQLRPVGCTSCLFYWSLLRWKSAL